MRAYVYTEYGGPENQLFVDRPTPVPGRGEMLVAVRAAGVNPADWKRRSGLRARLPLDQPIGLGREVAGVIEALGEGVTGFATGDEVLGTVPDGVFGGFAEYALVGPDAVHKPVGVSFVDAAALPIAAATAFDGVEQLGLTAGSALLVIGGGGGVGISACQIARNRGIKVIAVASSGKQKLVESVGAVCVPSGVGVADRVRAGSAQHVDGIFDTVGGDTLNALAKLVTDRSKLVSAADPSAASQLGGGPVDRKRSPAVLAAVVDMVKGGSLNPFVTEVVPFRQAGQALATVEAGHATGKVVLELT